MKKYTKKVKQSFLILNVVMLLFSIVSYLFLLVDIRQDVLNYGLSYNVTTIIEGIEQTDQINVQDKFGFSMFYMTIVIINVLNVVFFRGHEVDEEESEE